jgi:acyl dehydratase/NADP-dependent 3-hydroxy acid dehydrogenase YdfG
MNDPLATRIFSTADQEAFARWSGDRNPMHLDERSARRTQAGACVVHGIHAVLWALECLATDGAALGRLASLKARFNRFIYPGREVALHISRRTEDVTKLALTVDGLTVTTMTLTLGPRDSVLPDKFPNVPATVLSDVPLQPGFDAMGTLSGRLTSSAHARELAGHFPGLCAAVGDMRVRALALLSTLIGMACPGLHSIFAGFSVKLVEGADDRVDLSWCAERIDERFRMVWLAVGGAGIAGEVSAVARAEPVSPPHIAALSSLLASDEFAGRKALIVGGSRGLGAVTAKLLAAGGAQVVVTYATGKPEAEALVAEICAERGEHAAIGVACDVRRDVGPQLAGLPENITHLYYFATPRIYRQSNSVFCREVFDEFVQFYVDGFYAVSRCLMRACRNTFRNILYPSSVFVTDRPEGMTEYAMAKAAGEVLCADLRRVAPELSIATPRIPRVLTDQTATVPPVESADASSVMLALLRAERASLLDGIHR